jgi:hypothetical protein
LVTPGNSLTGFIFSTPDGPDQIAGPSASHSSTLASTSFVYSGAPFSDSGFEFVASVPEPASAGLIVATLLVGVRRHRRA